MSQVTRGPKVPTSNIEAWRPNSARQMMPLMRAEKELLIGGARGGGKTEIGQAWLVKGEEPRNEQYRALVIRHDYDDLRDWIFRAERFYGDLATISGNPPVIRWKWGGIAALGHWKDQRTLRKYLGHEYWRILVEEFTQTISSEKELKLLMGSLRSSVSGVNCQLMGTTNPGGVGHQFCKHYWVDKARDRVFVDPKTGYSRLFIPILPGDNLALPEEYKRWLDGLPDKLREMWAKGNWDVVEGMYFGNFATNKEYMAEEPFFVPSHVGKGRVGFGLDYGYGLQGISSGGLWFEDEDGVPHRCATWYRQGLTAEEQADDLYDFIDSFHFLDHVMPTWVYYDNQMDVPARQDERNRDFAPIDYFKKRFKGHTIQWIPANKKRVNGWQVVLDYFGLDIARKTPKMRYWPVFNSTFEDTFPFLEADPNNPMDVLKCDFDHCADETRYYLVGYRSRQTRREEESKRGRGGYNEAMQILAKMGKVSDTGLR